jgi:anti-sigma factor RsiW
MGCLGFDEDLSALQDGELAAARRAEVEAHVAGCARCEARLVVLRGVDRALAALPARGIPADLEARLAARLARAAPIDAAAAGRASAAPRAPAARPAHARAPLRARRLAPWLALPAAAAAALALYLAVRPPAGAPGGAGEPSVVAQAPAAPPAAPAAPLSPSAAPPAAPATPAEPAAQVAERVAPAPTEPDLDALDDEELGVALELETIEDLPVIANLDLLERLLERDAG